MTVDPKPTDNGAAPDLRAVTEQLIAGVSPAAVLKVLPDVVKVAGGVWWRTGMWGLDTSLRIGGTVVRGAISGRPAQSLVDDVTAQARHALRELLGVVDPDPMPAGLRKRIPVNGHSNGSAEITLPDRLAALLDASADLEYRPNAHPAYLRLLSELAPDEARILRLFAQRGAQPSVDVRTKRPFGVGSTLVKPGLTMIGRYAGCQDADRVPAYLNNLFRLGLVWFSREALPEQSVYDVLEAQEEVLDAMALAGRGMTVRRSIELTAFGRNLCAMTGLLPAAEQVSSTSAAQETRQTPPPDVR